jgi:hypothetical protein
LTTIDVDSLFTRLPQTELIRLLDDELCRLEINERTYFLYLVSFIIENNTFRVNKEYYHQKIGVPMGGVLSGSLANIYLGVLERNIVNNPKILLFKRYMDDILIISYFNHDENQEFVDNLRNSYKLPITVSSNEDSVNFLDLTITTSRLSSNLSISPYSKNHIIYPFPSLLKRGNVKNQCQIINSQILRTWRNSTDHRAFSFRILQYLKHLNNNPYHRVIRQKIIKFLNPVKLETHVWSTQIILCQTCRLISRANNTSIMKIIKAQNKYISARQPMNCQTRNVQLIIQEEEVFLQIEKWSSLHDFLLIEKRQNVNILPLGKLTEAQIQRLLNRHESLIHETIVAGPVQYNSCFIHDICIQPRKIYGVAVKTKGRRTIRNAFNQYKKVLNV